MAVSWTEQASRFKSPLRVVVAFLLRSRETQAKRAKSKTNEIQRLRKAVAEYEWEIASLGEQLANQNAELKRRRNENEQLRKQPLKLPADPPLPNHKYGPIMIALCVNLACRIGLRPVPDVLALVFQSLGIDAKPPTWSAVRTWVQRVGVAAAKRPVEEADDWIWMADHSNQIGPEKTLVVLGMRASGMPPPGQPLRHEDIRVLEIMPGTRWKRENMAEVYQQLAERCGTPLALLTDGAVELRDGADGLEKDGKKPVLLGDFKHHAANVLKKIVGGDESFSEFLTRLGNTRSAIQQTELGHLTPPSPKPKARFMNLAPILRWAGMVLWQLSHPHSEARRGITAARMNEKLGWLREFRDDIARWSQCQAVVSASLTWVNEQGMFAGAGCSLRDQLHRLEIIPTAKHVASRRVTARLLRFVREAESKVPAGRRLPMSTEILESSFGLYKQLEGQHSKGGFTSLLAGFGCLLQPSTPESIRRDFAEVSVKDMQSWVQSKLGSTLTSKRQVAYQEYRSAA